MPAPTINPSPIYSHGGLSEPRWPSVDGTSVGGGRPIQIYGADKPIAMNVICRSGAVTVEIQVNSGPTGNDGIPPEQDWIRIGGASLSVAPGSTDPMAIVFTIPENQNHVRTYILAAGDGCQMESYVPFIVGPNRQVTSARYPAIQSGPIGV